MYLFSITHMYQTIRDISLSILAYVHFISTHVKCNFFVIYKKNFLQKDKVKMYPYSEFHIYILHRSHFKAILVKVSWVGIYITHTHTQIPIE